MHRELGRPPTSGAPACPPCAVRPWQRGPLHEVPGRAQNDVPRSTRAPTVALKTTSRGQVVCTSVAIRKGLFDIAPCQFSQGVMQTRGPLKTGGGRPPCKLAGPVTTKCHEFARRSATSVLEGPRVCTDVGEAASQKLGHRRFEEGPQGRRRFVGVVIFTPVSSVQMHAGA